MSKLFVEHFARHVNDGGQARGHQILITRGCIHSLEKLVIFQSKNNLSRTAKPIGQELQKGTALTWP